jgi:hypothetical protein
MIPTPARPAAERDEFGIITRNAQLRALYGNRVTHGKARHIEALPEAATVNPLVRPPVVRRPPPEAPPTRIRGRNKKYANPDRQLAEAIRVAGAICNDMYCRNKRDKRLYFQSTMFLINVRARITLHEIAVMHGYADHTGARSQIRAVRDRMARDLTADEEEQRQARIMEIARPMARMK